MNGFMHGYGGLGWLFGLFGFLLFIAFFVGIILFVIWAVKQTKKGKTESQTGSQSSSAEEILKERYARGEIDREEYLSMQEDLKG